jgi:hypothetical protein
MKSSGFPTDEINGSGPSWAPDGGTEQDQQDDVSADEGLFLRTSDVDGPGVSQAVS